MEPNKPEKLYQCSQCDKLHDALHDAEDCCQPEVWTVYKCRGCGGIYETETAAADCCATSGEDCPACRVIMRIDAALKQQSEDAV